MSGKVTFQNVVHSFAPRSIAASSRWRGKPCIRARTVTTTKLMLNMMWAMRIVWSPSGKSIPPVSVLQRLRARCRRTASAGWRRGRSPGVAIGMKMNRFVPDRPRNVVARQGQGDERPEDRRDDRRDDGDDRGSSRAPPAGRAGRTGCARPPSENSPHTKLKRPGGSLNENAIITRIGSEQVERAPAPVKTGTQPAVDDAATDAPAGRARRRRRRRDVRAAIALMPAPPVSSSVPSARA